MSNGEHEHPGLGPVVAIAGAGFMATVHAHAARSAGARVAAVLASSPARLEASRAAVAADVAYTELDQILERTDVDVVHVCLPNALHASVASRAIAAGKHVVVEKPLATSVPAAQGLRDDAASAGIVGTVPFVYRFHPVVREMRARTLRGDVGRVSLIHGSYLQDWLAETGDYNWRVDPKTGGPSRTFADIGSHWFDLLEFVTGSQITQLSARTQTVHAQRTGPDQSFLDVETEDSVTVQFETTDGAIGTFAASQLARGRKNRLSLEVSGSRESFAFDQEKPEELWVGDAEGHRTIVRDPQSFSSAAREYAFLPAGHAQGYQDAFNAFVRDTYRAMNGAAPEGLPTFDAGLRSARIVDAVMASAHTGGTWTSVAEENTRETV